MNMIAMIAFKLRTVDRWGGPIFGSAGLGVIHSNKLDLWWVLGVFAFENTCFCVWFIYTLNSEKHVGPLVHLIF